LLVELHTTQMLGYGYLNMSIILYAPPPSSHTMW